MFYCLFFFKQKTAYEMRISDWSSDVCSSDLERAAVAKAHHLAPQRRSPPPLDEAAVAHHQATLDAPHLDQHALHARNPAVDRSEERRVGKECVSTCRSRWSPYH